MNAITIDVEDWFHVCGYDVDPAAGFFPRRVRPNIEKILRLLAEYEVRATFFVLGSVAEEDPSLVPLIAAGGHEIASHGYSHRPARQLGSEAFRDEIRRTGEILERQGGRKPVGFRAPQWSLGEDCPWAFQILWEEGYRYDSSLNPLPFVGDRTGPRFPFRVRAGRGELLEIPPMVTCSPIVNLPTGGGWGFRFFPRRMIHGTVDGYKRAGAPAVLYLHPREMEADGPRLALSTLRAFAVYGTRKDAAGRLRYLLERCPFGTLHAVVESWKSA
jgi:polysaccharide deacetylase family protein (PEP-CTERM system associated)